MKLEKLAGATSEIWQIFVRDSSSSTGAGLTGLAFNTASLTAYFHRDTDTTATAVSLVTMTVGTFTSSGFKEIDATNMPGHYQFCPPNAAIQSGAKSCMFHLKGATNMAPLPIEVQLVSYNPDDSVRIGLTALPNATAGGAAGVPVVGTGANNFKSDSSANVTFANTLIATVTNLTNLPSIPANWLTAAGVAAGALDAVWSTAVRLLTAGTNIVLAKGTGITGFNDIAAGTAMTLTSAYDAAKTAGDATAANQITINNNVLTRLASASYTAPDNTSIGAIKTQTDKMTFTVAGYQSVDIRYVNGTLVNGAGTSGSPWGP